MQIISNKTEFVKKIIKLQNKKHRDAQGVFVVEGFIGVKEAFRFGADIKAVVTSQTFSLANADFLYGLDDKVQCRVVTDVIFEDMVDTINSQGIVAIVSKPNYNDATIDWATLSTKNTKCLYLDRIRDPGNMGSILRTAVATGFELVIVDNCVDIYNNKVVRSAASALYNLTIFSECQLQDLKKYYKIVATAPLGQNFFDARIDNDNICLVVGNEASGVSKPILELADKVVALPMSKIESLNASVAAGVLMYGISFELTTKATS